MNDEDDKDAKFPRAEDDFVMKLNLGTQERELPVTEIKSRIIRAIAEASPEIVAVQNGPSTYIKSTYIKSTYIKSTYIKSTYIKSTYIKSTYIKSTYIKSTYIKATYIKATYIKATYIKSWF